MQQKQEKEKRIDVVITWVDGSDPAWLAEKSRVSPAIRSDDRPIRYRDWGVLQYLFRGLERFAPWVDTVHLVTWGHLPAWLNSAHPKLNIVNHRDFIPAAYLPTFNANTIELNLHRIEGLAEQFIFFNDDMFLLRPVKVTRFFQRGLPCDFAVMNPAHTMDLAPGAGDERIFYIPYNDVNYLNSRYAMRASVAKHPFKWFNPVYGKDLLRNILLYPWRRFVGFDDPHLPQPYLKSSFEVAWMDFISVMDATCRNPNRTDDDVNAWIIRYRQLATGQFHPIHPPKHAVFTLKTDYSVALDLIRRQKRPMICLNDNPLIDQDFLQEQKKLQRAFQQILPEKCGFER